MRQYKIQQGEGSNGLAPTTDKDGGDFPLLIATGSQDPSCPPAKFQTPPSRSRSTLPPTHATTNNDKSSCFK
jgi:hypothetical protein